MSQSNNKEKLWTKDYISITAISFFIFFTFYLLVTALPLYLVQNLDAGADKAGLILTTFLIAAIVIRPFAGQWVSRGSEKKILVYSAIAFFAGCLLYPFATNIWALLILRVLHGFTFGVITTVKGTICAEIIPNTRRGEGLSYFSLAMSLAMVVGPFIALKLANVQAYNTLFIVAMVVSLVNVLLSVWMKVPEHTKSATSQDKKPAFSMNDLFDKKAAPYALAVFLLACAYSGVSAFLSLYATELNLVEAASIFFIVYAVFMMISRPFTGRWADRFGSKIIIYPCLVIFAIGLLLLSFSTTSALMIISGALIGLGYGSVTPVFQTQTISSVEPHRVGIANSLYFNSMDLGMSIGAFVLGILAGGMGYRSVYLSGVVLIIVTGVLYMALTQKKTQTNASPATNQIIK